MADSYRYRFDRTNEETLVSVYASARASLTGSAVLCEAATASRHLRIDLLEMTKDQRLQVYEFKKVASPGQLHERYYEAIGQLSVYSSILKAPHTKRIILVAPKMPPNDIRWKGFVKRSAHVRDRLKIHTLVCDFHEILDLRESVGYKPHSNDNGLLNHLEHF